MAQPALEITVCDHDAMPLGVVADYYSAEVTWIRNDVANATLVMNGDGPMAARLKECAPTPYRRFGDVVPVTIKYNGELWTGRALTYESVGTPGNRVLTVQLVSDWYHMRTILAWPNPVLPLGAQWPQNDPFIGGIDAGVKYYAFKNSARLRMPLEVLWPDKSDLFDVKNWQNFLARMVPLDELFREAIKDTDANVTLSMHWPHMGPLRDGRKITKPKLVLDVQKVRDNRRVKWSEEEGGGIINARVSGKGSTGAHIIVGGKSYDFINTVVSQGANAIVNGALDFFGLAGVGNIITGQLDNVFLAFNKFDDWDTILSHGDFYFREAYANGGAGGFTADAVQAGMQGIHEHKARRTVRFEVQDGLPYSFGKDYRVGDLVQAFVEGEWHEQVVNSATVKDDRSNGVSVSAVIGDDDIGEHPLSRIIRRHKGLESWVKAQSLAS